LVEGIKETFMSDTPASQPTTPAAPQAAPVPTAKVPSKNPIVRFWQKHFSWNHHRASEIHKQDAELFRSNAKGAEELAGKAWEKHKAAVDGRQAAIDGGKSVAEVDGQINFLRQQADVHDRNTKFWNGRAETAETRAGTLAEKAASKGGKVAVVAKDAAPATPAADPAHVADGAAPKPAADPAIVAEEKLGFVEKHFPGLKEPGLGKQAIRNINPFGEHAVNRRAFATVRAGGTMVGAYMMGDALLRGKKGDGEDRGTAGRVLEFVAGGGVGAASALSGAARVAVAAAHI
jgi:hypothetical protein